MMSNEKRSVTARLNPTRKAKLEALASCYYKGSQADTIRRWIDEQFSLVFGDLDPTALLDGRVDETDARTIMSDIETDTDELLEDVGINDDLRMDDDDAVPAVAQDGGVVTSQPERFETMLGPEELAKSGPALEWDELREIVADDGHWSQTLEIHPDRVQLGTLKSNHKTTSRILAAMVRSKATGPLVEESLLKEVIVENTDHLHDRALESEGRVYMKDTYLPLVKRHLFVHPSPTNDFLFVDRAVAATNMESRLEDQWQNLHSETSLTTAELLNPETWQDATGMKRFDKPEWHADLALWLSDIVALWNVQDQLDSEYGLPSEELAVNVPDEHASASTWVVESVMQLLDQFEQNVPEEDVEKTLENHLDADAANTVRGLLS